MLVCHLLAFQGCCLYPPGASAAAALLTLAQLQLLCGPTDVCSHMYRLIAFDCRSLVPEKEAPPARVKGEAESAIQEAVL